MDIIDKVSFAMDDTRLFLDTHPYSKEALMFFGRMQEKRNAALKEYSEAYGPLCAYDVPPADMWKWNQGPWPWQASYRDGRC